MEEENKVELYGFWGSPYVNKVKLALKLKGIPYKYVEEDLLNKSELLIQYNPVHNKVPILVHNGKPIAESLVILEYIDETWKSGPRILPEEPYHRAKVRFWAIYFHQQLALGMRLVLTTVGEAQEKAIKGLFEKLKVVEEGIVKDYFHGGLLSIKNQKYLGLLDIVIFSVLGSYKASEEVTGMKLIEEERNPLIFSWITSLKDLPIFEHTFPSHANMVSLLHSYRHRCLQMMPIS